MKILAWIVGLAVGGFCLSAIAINWGIVIMGLRAKPGEKTPSCIPIIGGLLGGLSIKFAASLYAVAHHPLKADWAWMAWLPPLLDPGCYVIMLPFVAVAAVMRRMRGD